MWAVLSSLFFVVLVMMTKLVPTDEPLSRHGRLAYATALVAFQEEPLYRGDETREKTVSLLVAVEFRESTLKHDAVGDGGHSVCAMQIYDGPRSLLEDTEECVRTGYRMLKTSMRHDPDNPIAFYARGRHYLGCKGSRDPNEKKVCEEARGISRDRMALAKSLRTAP